MKRLLLLLLAGLLLVTGQIPRAQATNEKSLNLALKETPNSLDPGISADNYSGAILMNTMEGLTRLDLQGDPQPAMAESWEISEDGLTYTFKLRQAEWSNGQLVTSHDFVNGWTRILSKKVDSQAVDQFFLIQNAEAFYKEEVGEEALGIQAIDDQTFEVTLSHPTPYFLELMANYYFSPVYQDDSKITNGPFQVDEYKNDEMITLVKNDHYWDKESVQLETVNVRIIPSESTVANEFLAGNIDFIGMPFGNISFNHQDLFKDQIQSTTPSTSYNYRINTTDEELMNADLRKALALSINREELIKNVTRGQEVPANGLIPPIVEGFESEDLFDLEAAKEHLEKALKDLKVDAPDKLDIVMETNGGEDHSTVAQYLQNQWKTHLGIDVKINLVEWNIHYDNLQNLNFKLGRIANPALYKDATSFLNPFVEKDNIYNMTGWHNSDYTQLVKQAESEPDMDKRLELLQESHVLLLEEMPFVPVYFYGRDYVVNDSFTDLKPLPIGGVNLKYVKNN